MPKTPPQASSPEERLLDFIHELRQPLSSIEAIAYYLEMTLPAEQVQARGHMAQLQRLVAEASAVLERYAGGVRKPSVRAGAAGAQ
jgi:signal transduction histidine kinase